MNLTLAVDEQTVERAREVAREQGTSLNALIRDYIERLAGQRTGSQVLSELEALWARSTADSGGYKFRREDAYAGRVAEGRRGRPRVR